ncbi:MAG TPA: STAS domain-containing protein [Candidatus Acidoferrum sp.]|nr:STAS domain-containing protein [Candidatus Acidoferrum sp.]
MTDENLQIVLAQGTNGLSIMRLKGPLNIRTLFAFHDAVRKEPPPALILDFEGVPYIDSAGLGALVAANVAGNKAGRKLALAGLTKQVQALLEMTHVLQLFKVYPAVHEAEIALAEQVQR